MRREVIQISLGTMLTVLLATGCVSHRAYRPVVATSPTGEVVVTEAPPAPRQEVVTVASSPAHVWVRGYWVHSDRRWVWMPGHWEVRPRAGVAWVQGHWDRTSAGWV